MKLEIDELTGEVIETEDTNDIATRKLMECGAITESTYELLDNYLMYQQQYEVFKNALLKAMKENNIKSWSNEYFTATYIDESLQKRVDTDKLKAKGLYEENLKLIPIKERLNIRFKNDK